MGIIRVMAFNDIFKSAAWHLPLIANPRNKTHLITLSANELFSSFNDFKFETVHDMMLMMMWASIVVNET
jgi:hypothetical protein